MYFFLQSGGPDPTPVAPTTEEQVEEPLEAAPEIAPELSRQDRETDAVDAVERTKMVLPESGPNITYGDAVEEGLLIRVIDGNTSEALPRAEVMVIDTGITDMRQVEVAIQSRPDFEKLFLEMGITYRSDAKGEVMIPDPTGDLLIAGRTPTHFNFAFDIDDDPEEYILRLNPTELLAVKVIDEEGRPVKGAPVSLRMRNNGFSQDLIQAHSGADGIANLKIFDLIKMELSDDDVAVALLALTDTPIEADVKLRELPEEPLVLTMPRLGMVEVRVFDDTGALVKDSYIVDLALIEDEEFQQQEDTELNYWREARPHIVGPTRDGIAVFPLVQPGTKLRAVAVSRDGEKRAHVDAHGPARIGEKVSISVAPELDRPIVTGRIVNEEGMAGANLTMKSRLSTKRRGNSSSHNGNIKTDAEGRFRMVLEDEFEDGGSRELTITMRKTKRKPKRSVLVDLSRRFEPGVHDLGDLVVVVPPLLAEGVVLSPEGEPVHKADVMLEEARTYGSNDEHRYWSGLWEFREQTDRDGHFEIRGHVKDAVYRVSARHDDFIEANQETALGATGLRLNLLNAVRVKGRFLLDEGVDPEQLQVSLIRPSADDPHRNDSVDADLDTKGNFEFQHQGGGTVALQLMSEGTDYELHVMHDVLLDPAAGSVHDLGEIDLRNRLQVVEILVVDSTGRPIENPHVKPIGQRWSHSSDENPVQLVSSGDGFDIHVSAKGYRPQELRDLRVDTTVTLLDGIPVRLQVRNGALLPDGFTIQARLHHYPDGPDGEHVSDMDGRTDGGRDSIVGTVNAAGTYLVQFTLRREANGGFQSWALPGGEQMVDVLDSPAEQRYSVDIPESILKFADEKEFEVF